MAKVKSKGGPGVVFSALGAITGLKEVQNFVHAISNAMSSAGVQQAAQEYFGNATYAEYIDDLLAEPGVNGVLAGVYCFDMAGVPISKFPVLYTGPMIVGAGKDVDAALLDYWMSERVIDEPFPTYAFARGLVDAPPDKLKMGDECFGVWIGKGTGKGGRDIKYVEDIVARNQTAVLKFAVYKSNLALLKHKDLITQFQQTTKIYTKLAEKWRLKLLEAGAWDKINSLLQANHDAQEKYLGALNSVEKAQERANKYAGYAKIGAILQMAGSFIGVYEKFQAEAQSEVTQSKELAKAQKNIIIQLSVDIKNTIQFNTPEKSENIPQVTQTLP